MRVKREEHLKLRGGKGKVITYTVRLKKWLLFGEPDKKQAIKLVFDPFASVGWHWHTEDSEIYITFNRRVRFNGRKHWFPINVCLRGHRHMAVNDSNEPAKLYAFKF